MRSRMKLLMEVINRYYIVQGLRLVHHDGNYTRIRSTYQWDYWIRFGMKTGLNQFYIVRCRSHYEIWTIRRNSDYKSTSHTIKLNFPWNLRIVIHISILQLLDINESLPKALSFSFCSALYPIWSLTGKKTVWTKWTKSAKLVKLTWKLIKAEVCFVVITVIML